MLSHGFNAAKNKNSAMVYTDTEGRVVPMKYSPTLLAEAARKLAMWRVFVEPLFGDQTPKRSKQTIPVAFAKPVVPVRPKKPMPKRDALF